jgi:hypothetical protein
LIVTGAVLASVPHDFRLVRVAGVLLGTLTIYWAAETYVHWTAARTVLQRDLNATERRTVVIDGWPLVAASGIPLLLLAIEALLHIQTGVAVTIALLVNTGLLLIVGYQMGKAGGIRGIRLLGASALTGLLGIALIGLKTLLH